MRQEGTSVANEAGWFRSRFACFRGNRGDGCGEEFFLFSLYCLRRLKDFFFLKKIVLGIWELCVFGGGGGRGASVGLHDTTESGRKSRVTQMVRLFFHLGSPPPSPTPIFSTDAILAGFVVKDICLCSLTVTKAGALDSEIVLAVLSQHSLSLSKKHI